MLVSDRQKYFVGAARPICRSMPTTIPTFCGGIAREGKPYNIDMHPKKLGGKFAKISFTGFAPF